MTNIDSQLYLAPRDNTFTEFLANVLQKHGINPEKFLTEEGCKIFASAFTHKSVSDENYEWLEQIGDAIHNSFFISYLYNRYPKLKSFTYVKVVARAKILYCSREKFARLGDNLGLFPWVSAKTVDYNHDKKKLLEDIFEALLGAISIIGDTIDDCYGYVCVSKFLKTIYDKIDFDFSYENLFDSKTRLKEFVDLNPLHKITYISSQDKIDHKHSISVVWSFNNKQEIIGKSEAFKKIDAEKNSAQQALVLLEKRGFKIHKSESFQMFAVENL